jgi:hypothetical protein
MRFWARPTARAMQKLGRAGGRPGLPFSWAPSNQSMSKLTIDETAVQACEGDPQPKVDPESRMHLSCHLQGCHISLTAWAWSFAFMPKTRVRDIIQIRHFSGGDGLKGGRCHIALLRGTFSSLADSC